MGMGGKEFGWMEDCDAIPLFCLWPRCVGSWSSHLPFCSFLLLLLRYGAIFLLSSPRSFLCHPKNAGWCCWAGWLAGPFDARPSLLILTLAKEIDPSSSTWARTSLLWACAAQGPGSRVSWLAGAALPCNCADVRLATGLAISTPRTQKLLGPPTARPCLVSRCLHFTLP